MEDTNRTDFDAALAAGTALAGKVVELIRPAGTRPGPAFVMVPEGYKVADLEAMQDVPVRPRGTVTVADEESFALLAERFASPARQIYCAPSTTLGQPPTFTAVLNDHASLDAPGWRDHRVVFTPKLSIEWVEWTKASGVPLPQASFAHWLESRVPEIIKPAGAQMLEIALSIEAKKKVDFASGVRLQNGTHQLTYVETIEGTAGKGQLAIPETIEIAVPVFYGGQTYKVEARLRYRIGDNKQLAMWVELIRPEHTYDHAATQIRERLATRLGQPLLVGTPG